MGLSIEDHLQWWGLRRFDDGTAYERWQDQMLSPEEQAALQRLAQRKRFSKTPLDEIAFYDWSAKPAILPVLYSQRYDYFVLLSSILSPFLSQASTVLDYGCGPGILTTFFAGLFPHSTFVGVDRSSECIRVARNRSQALEMKNVCFDCADVLETDNLGFFQVILSCHALLQAEQDPGIPSQSWATFERKQDSASQISFETRTGVGKKIDCLLKALAPGGHMLLFEKTFHLGRRIPFQRALALRGLVPTRKPQVLTYFDMDQPVEDGPLYIVTPKVEGSDPTVGWEEWDERPTIPEVSDRYSKRGATAEFLFHRLPGKVVVAKRKVNWNGDGETRVEWGHFGTIFYYCYCQRETNDQGLLVGGPSSKDRFRNWFEKAEKSGFAQPEQIYSEIFPSWGSEEKSDSNPLEVPIYENHSLVAQEIWKLLPRMSLIREMTKTGVEGRQIHIELGITETLIYLYCANTFDQRQLVLVEKSRRKLLEDYFQELCQTREESSEAD